MFANCLLSVPTIYFYPVNGKAFVHIFAFLVMFYQSRWAHFTKSENQISVAKYMYLYERTQIWPTFLTPITKHKEAGNAHLSYGSLWLLGQWLSNLQQLSSHYMLSMQNGWTVTDSRPFNVFLWHTTEIFIVYLKELEFEIKGMSLLFFRILTRLYMWFWGLQRLRYNYQGKLIFMWLVISR